MMSTYLEVHFPRDVGNLFYGGITEHKETCSVDIARYFYVEEKTGNYLLVWYYSEEYLQYKRHVEDILKRNIESNTDLNQDALIFRHVLAI